MKSEILETVKTIVSGWRTREQPQGKRKQYSREERMNILITQVLKWTRETAAAKLPQKGKFTKFGIGLCFPDDEEFRGVLNIECAAEPDRRVANVGVYRVGTDRLVSNYFFFDSTKEVMEWLEAEQTVPLLIETYCHLRERVENAD